MTTQQIGPFPDLAEFPDDLNFEPPPDEAYEQVEDYFFDPALLEAPEVTPDIGEIPGDLTPEQRQVVEALTGPVMVVAGPGAGKTRTLIERIVNAIRTGTDPRRILAVTFTRKAAGEMRERLAAALGEQRSKEVTTATFHSFSSQVVRTSGHRIGLKPDFEVMDTSEQKRIIAALAKEAGMDPKTQVYLHEISRANHKVELETVEQRVAWLKQVKQHDAAALLAPYTKEKQRLGRLDYDDLLLYAYQLLRMPDVEESWAGRFDHVLVDEYQDTDSLQASLMAKVSSKATSIMVVGDVDQSIYEWRGANPEILMNFQETYPSARAITLHDNFRSSPQILDVVRETIGPIPWEHRSNLSPNKPSGAAPSIIQASDNKAEAQTIAGWVQSLLHKGTEPTEIAVLFRGRKQSLQLQSELTRNRVPYRLTGGQNFYDSKLVKDVIAWLRMAMKPADEPTFLRLVTQIPGLGEKRAQEILESAQAEEDDGSIIAWSERFTHNQTTLKKKVPKYVESLKYLVNQVALIRLRLESSGLAAAVQAAAGAIPQETLDRDEVDSAQLNDSVNQLVADAEGFTPEHPLELEEGLEVRHPVLGYGIVQEELKSAWTVEFENGESKEFPKDTVQDVLCKDSASSIAPSLEFLQTISLDKQQLEDLDGAVAELTTIHAAKGREFDHVWIMGMIDGSFPTQGEYKNGDPIMYPDDEERRLMFVAASRARKELNMSTYGFMRYKNGGFGKVNPSVFLYELQGTGLCQQDRPLPPPQYIKRQW